VSFVEHHRDTDCPICTVIAQLDRAIQ